MNKETMKTMAKNFKTSLSKRSPEILLGFGLATGGAAIAFAIRDTPKALKLIEAKKKEEHKDELTRVEIVQTCWKVYAPTIISATFSTVCILGSHSVNARRTAAIATAYKLSETAFAEYKDKVIETIGEKKEKDVRDKVAKSKVENNPTKQSTVFVTGKGNTRFRDAAFGGTFVSDIESIKKAVNELNRRMIYENYISLNEFYSEIGLESVDMGSDLGWNLDSGMIELDFSAQIDVDGTPIIVMSYLVAPRYDFAKLY